MALSVARLSITTFSGTFALDFRVYRMGSLKHAVTGASSCGQLSLCNIFRMADETNIQLINGLVRNCWGSSFQLVVESWGQICWTSHREHKEYSGCFIRPVEKAVKWKSELELRQVQDVNFPKNYMFVMTRVTVYPEVYEIPPSYCSLRREKKLTHF